MASQINPDMKYTPANVRAVEDGWKNDEEAHTLLDLINLEFHSDPMSVQCLIKEL